MTALKPLEDLRVRGVVAKRYPSNPICAHPNCTRESDGGNHHIFPRSQIGNSSWFVELGEDAAKPQPASYVSAKAIPHVVGLCKPHHNDVEEHRAWIKLEDGEFVWYEREEIPGSESAGDPPSEQWKRVGPLNPQPGAREGKPKRTKPTKSTGPVKVASFKAPDDDPEAAERIKEKSAILRDKFNAAGHKIGKTVAVERALDFTLLNATNEDL